MDFTSASYSDFNRCRNDPEYFIEAHVKVDGASMVLHPYDLRVIYNFVKYRKNIQMQSRMMGMTTLAAALLLWRAIFHNDQTIGYSAPTHENAKRFLTIIRDMHSLLPEHVRPKLAENTQACMSMDNGSRIFVGGMATSFMRGMSVSLLYCDDFACASVNLQKKFLSAILPCLSNGDVFIASCPESNDDEFTRLWDHACDKWRGTLWRLEQISERERV